jgi:cytochrome P450
MIKFIFNLIIEAGIDTSQTTLKWIILFMANYPEMQNKMREEIESVIGDRMPVQEDRNNCHYVNAFISETMRYRSIIPMGVVHKNVVQSKIGIINKKKVLKS